MPPNLLIKAAFVRGELEERNNYNNINEIRTDFILKNIYSYGLYSDDCISPQNNKEEEVLKRIQEIVKVFQQKFESTIKILLSDVEVTEDSIGSVLLGAANELFCEGITWNRIVALFVFVNELANLCLSRDLPEYAVDIVYDVFSKLFKEKIMSWIHDKGGWEGIESVSIVKEQEISSKTFNPGEWIKSLLYGISSMISTVANIAINALKIPSEVNHNAPVKLPPTVNTVASSNPSKLPLTEEKFDDTNHLTCKICLDSKSSIVFQCGHLISCETCASKLEKCSMCRENITRKIKVFTC